MIILFKEIIQKRRGGGGTSIGQSRNSETTYDPEKLKEAIKKNKRIHDTLNLEKYPFQTAVFFLMM